MRDSKMEQEQKTQQCLQDRKEEEDEEREGMRERSLEADIIKNNYQ